MALSFPVVPAFQHTSRLSPSCRPSPSFSAQVSAGSKKESGVVASLLRIPFCGSSSPALSVARPQTDSFLNTAGSMSMSLSLSLSSHSHPQRLSLVSSQRLRAAASPLLPCAGVSTRFSGSAGVAAASSAGIAVEEKEGKGTEEPEGSEETKGGKGTGDGVRTALNVLVTGSTKGIGLALAKEFLRLGDNVVITSRTQESVAETALALGVEFGAGRVWGTTCDVSDPKSVAALSEFAKESMGRVDVWINNAGTNAYFYGPIVDCQVDDLKEIVATNVLGIMLCCREAITLMRSQPSGGHIFNMDGAGADGNATPRFAAYGATKRSLAQFTKSLQAELKMMQVPNVVVHNLSPGMVTTDLLMSGANNPQAKFFINALAEPAADVAKFLVPRVREVASSPSTPPSSYIKFLTRPKALTQIFQRFLFKARKGRYVPEDDN